MPHRLSIEVIRRLVQDEERWPAQQGASQRETLALAAGQQHPVVADRRLVAEWKIADEIMRVRGLGRLDNGIEGRTGRAQGDVFYESVPEMSSGS